MNDNCTLLVYFLLELLAYWTEKLLNQKFCPSKEIGINLGRVARTKEDIGWVK